MLLEGSEQVSIKNINASELPQVKDWMLNHHYIRGWPKAVQAVLGVYIDGKLSGALLYGIGTRGGATSEIFRNDDGSPIMQNNQMWELQRAFTTEEAKQAVTNLGSICISKGNDFIRQNAKTKDGKPVKAIISFADSAAGHKGSVYQSTNALYLGEMRPLPYYIVTNPETGKYVRKAQLTPNAKEILKNRGYTIERKIPEKGKHKFLYPLGKDQNERDILAAKIVKPLFDYPDGITQPKQIPNLAKERIAKKQQISKPQQTTSKRQLIKTLLNSKVKNPETGNAILVSTALKYDKTHPSYKQARGMVTAWAKKHNIKVSDTK